jgi:hypothetical protein
MKAPVFRKYKGVAVDPTINAIAQYLDDEGYRITSILRGKAESHRMGKAVDIAPWIRNDSWATLEAAQRLYRHLAPMFGDRLSVVGEDNHIHIDVLGYPGAGYDGINGSVFPYIP